MLGTIGCDLTLANSHGKRNYVRKQNNDINGIVRPFEFEKVEPGRLSKV